VAALIALMTFGVFRLHQAVRKNQRGNDAERLQSETKGTKNWDTRDGSKRTIEGENPEMMALCKLGRFHYLKLTEEGFAKAMECLNKAIAIDPKSVLAYATMADFCVYSQPSQFLPPHAAETKMRWAGDKLIDIDSHRAEGHAVQGFIHLVYDWSPAEAERELNLALTLDPDLLLAHIWHGRFLVYTRQFEEAEQEYKKAQQLDPTRYGLNVHVGLPSFYARHYGRAIEYFEKAIEVVPSLDWAVWMIGRANEEKGDYAAAVEALQKAELAQGGKPERVKQKYDELRAAYQTSGEDGYWRKKLAFAQSEYGGWRAWFDAQEIAQIHARLSEADKAFEWLDKAFHEKSEYLLWLNVDPSWDNIRSDPRFLALIQKMGLAK
jgi:tetratricopeptide (TPR) repeat protein